MKNKLYPITMSHKSRIVLSIIFFSIASLSVGLAGIGDRAAASRPAFNASHIISDQTMREQSMSRAEIQSFLNVKGINCSGGSNCLKNYTQDGKSAAQIIYDVGREYRINPQVLIVLTQKEVGLVTASNPQPWQYRTAMGYGCPDSTPGKCNDSYYGFANQTRWAATMFDAILRNSSSWYAPYTIGQNDILLHPHNNCGTQRVNIQNRATAALYSYTPYVPNRAALNAGYGEGDECSSYGNRNFHNYFYDWFTNTQNVAESAIAYRHMMANSRVRAALGPEKSSVRCGLINNGCYKNYQNGAILWTKDTGAWESLGSIRKTWIESGYERGSMGYPISGEIPLDTGGWYQRYEKGHIIGKGSTGYWESKGSIRNRWVQTGLERGGLGYPIGPETNISTGGWKQDYENGVILGRGSSGYWDIRGEILERYRQMNESSSNLGYPVSGPMCGIHKNGCYQNFEKGSILWTEQTGAWESLGSIRKTWIKSGYEHGAMGYPTGPEVAVATGGWQQAYENGTITGKGSTGYWESKGSIRSHWLTIDSHSGILGYPIGPEIRIAGGWQQAYENGTIFGRASTGYWSSTTQIAKRHQALDGVTGKLGYPTARTICGIAKDGCYQNFQRGAILWTPKTGAWESLGTIRAFWISQGRETGRLGYPIGPEVKARDGSWSQLYENGTVFSRKGVGSAIYR